MSESTAQRNKALVLEAFEAPFNRKDFVAAEKFWLPNDIQHSARIPPGRDGLLGLVKSAPSRMKYESTGTRREFLGLTTAAALFEASTPAFAASEAFMR